MSRKGSAVRTAFCPGSFDPIHNGHLEIIEAAASLFDRVVVAAIRNPGKSEPMFSLDEREEMLRELLGGLSNVEVVSMAELTVDVAKDMDADVIVKGLRTAPDFEYESRQARMNHAISGIETIFLPCDSPSRFIASSLVRQTAQFGGTDRIGPMVPAAVARRLKQRHAS